MTDIGNLDGYLELDSEVNELREPHTPRQSTPWPGNNYNLDDIDDTGVSLCCGEPVFIKRIGDRTVIACSLCGEPTQ